MRRLVWSDLLLLGAFSAMTIQWPMSVGPLAFDLAEPLVIVLLLAYFLLTRAQQVALSPRRRIVWSAAVIVLAWAGGIWLVAPNWRGRRLDLIGWIAPLVLLVVLLHDRPRSWSHFARLFVLASLPTLVAVFLERALNVGGPFYSPVGTKSLLGWMGGAITFPVAGLFGHSNNLASYLLWILVLTLGLWWGARGRERLAWTALGLTLGAALLFSLARTTIIALAFAGMVLLALTVLRTRGRFVLGVLVGGALIAVLTIIFLNRLGVDYALSGRPELWMRALRLINRNPAFLVTGYLGLKPSLSDAWYLAHNLYLLGLLMYGLPGALAMIGLGLWTVWIGWRDFERLREHLLAGALWSGMLAFFLVQGAVSLDLHEAVPRLIFLTVLVAYLGLLEEARAGRGASAVRAAAAG